VFQRDEVVEREARVVLARNRPQDPDSIQAIRALVTDSFSMVPGNGHLKDDLWHTACSILSVDERLDVATTYFGDPSLVGSHAMGRFRELLESLSVEADQELEQRHWLRALELADQVVEDTCMLSEPGSSVPPSAIELRARVLLHLGRTEEGPPALELLEFAAALPAEWFPADRTGSPRRGKAVLEWADLLIETGRFKEAEAALVAASVFRYRNLGDQLWTTLAEMFVQQGRLVELECLRRSQNLPADWEPSPEE
jgi:hypothetical protein